MDWICQVTGATSAERGEHIQTLWGGYGSLDRWHLTDAERPSVIVKHVQPPTARDHPRGWNTDRSHQRKLRSYEVEAEWYRTFAARCHAQVRVPQCHGVRTVDHETTFVLEDLDDAGFSARRVDLDATHRDFDHCLEWLAEFHATFLGVDPQGLWPVGTYWHLATRPDELEALDDQALQKAAAAIDQRLSGGRFRTLVHGDAKLANFCFAPNASAAAAVDFQYVGGGCGIKDVMYFLSSCLSSRECEQHASDAIDRYFDHLRTAVARRNRDVEFEALEQEWRALYPFAWADFVRFLGGWSPGHWKLGPYADRQTTDALRILSTPERSK